MASETTPLKARCLCGAVRYNITLPSSAFPLLAGICHCNSCRRTTGALALTIANLPPSWTPPRELIDGMVPYDFSDRLKHYHCKTCGSYMMTHCVQDPKDLSKGQNWDIGCGTLENADTSTYHFAYHEYVADTLDGGLADFLPTFDGKHIPRMAQSPKTSEQLPLYWQSSSQPHVTISPADKLHCRCKCGGVEYWISRPSEWAKKASDKSSRGLQADRTKFLGGLCCCKSCRLHTGQEVHSWAFIPEVDISLDAQGTDKFRLPFGTLQAYKSSSEETRYFCDNCAAKVFITRSDLGGLVGAGIGLFDAAEGSRAESWITFSTQNLSICNDNAIPEGKQLVLALKGGLKQFGERKEK